MLVDFFKTLIESQNNEVLNLNKEERKILEMLVKE